VKAWLSVKTATATLRKATSVLYWLLLWRFHLTQRLFARTLSLSSLSQSHHLKRRVSSLLVTEADRDEFQRYGDVNRDGIIDLDDIMLVGAAYGAYVGQPKYNILLDLNGDGVIDIDDYGLVAGRFGMTIDEYMAKFHPPPTYIYTLKITFMKMAWFNQAAFEGIVNTAIVTPVKPIIGALGYTYTATTIDYKNSTVEVNMQFSGAGSPAITAAVLGAIVVGAIIGVGLIVIGVAWYKQAQVQEKHEVTTQEAQAQLYQALQAGLISSEQYTEIMKKLEEAPPAGIDWTTMVIPALLIIGAIVLLPKVLPERKG